MSGRNASLAVRYAEAARTGASTSLAVATYVTVSVR